MTTMQLREEHELNELKLAILEEQLPAECDMIGYRDLKVILEHPVEMITSEFGSKLDHFQIYQTIISFVGFINACISIYKHITTKQKKDKAQLENIKRELIESKTTTTITEGDKIQIIERIEKHYKIYE